MRGNQKQRRKGDGMDIDELIDELVEQAMEIAIVSDDPYAERAADIRRLVVKLMQRQCG
jgi:hypothetical protein